MLWWETLSFKSYKWMQDIHPTMWEYLRNFIKENKVKSILEVGVGYAWIPEYGIKDYVGIDFNEKVQEINQKRYPQFKFVVEDFADTDPAKYHGRFDAVFIIGVIEHSPRWKEFLANAVDMKPKYVVINFFNRLNHVKPKYRQVKKNGVFHCHLFYHTRKEIEDALAEIGVKKEEYEIFDIPQLDTRTPMETMLVLRLNEEVKT